MTQGFFNLFNICANLTGCFHVPFTPQCNDAPSIKEAISKHMMNCLKTQPEVENFKNEVLRIIEQAAQTNPSLPSAPNY